MFKFINIIFCLSLFLYASNSKLKKGFEYKGVEVDYLNPKKYAIVHTKIQRNIPKECEKLTISNKTIWSGNYAQDGVNPLCKKTFVTTVGKLLPMEIHDEIDTYGVLEVLASIKEKTLLIDSRKQEWFDYQTIPTAINMPFHHFKERESFEFEFEHHLRILGVTKQNNNRFDFHNAKDMIIFCNGSWCSQSVALIKILLEIGYPAEKIKWFRGGMQEWLTANMTSTR